MRWRLSSAPIFVQTLGLVTASVLLAQVLTLALLIAGPLPPPTPFTLGDVGTAARTQRPVVRGGQTLSVAITEAPPAEWHSDLGPVEPVIRAELARLLTLPPDRVLVEGRLPFPGAKTLIRLFGGQERVGGSSRPRKSDLGYWVRFPFDRADAAVRLADGRWVIVSTPDPWLSPFGKLVLLWSMGVTALLLPLVWLFTKRLVRPIRRFAEAAEKAGAGDSEASFGAAGPAEIRTAAQALSEMQRRLAATVQERTRLVAAVAHDLRTPLTRLRLRAEFAPEEQRERMARDIEQMDGMISGVLAFARGETQAERHLLDLASLVESLVDDLAEAGSDVSFEAVERVEVTGDAVALRRMIGNVVDNAVKYGSRARCFVGARGDFAIIRVDDEGPGIAASEREHVFEPFYRGDPARDPSTGGVGLGLAVAREIARAHGGDIRVTGDGSAGTSLEIWIRHGRCARFDTVPRRSS